VKNENRIWAATLIVVASLVACTIVLVVAIRKEPPPQIQRIEIDSPFSGMTPTTQPNGLTPAEQIQKKLDETIEQGSAR